ncbi:TPA: hypothetical protein KD834_004598 [Vibrio parahaemolyticus]|nr:hypothetical protein [Vibrio parahaemolyticus]
MKNKIAVNTKFFKRSQRAVITHVVRGFDNDKNVIDNNLTQDNFGTNDNDIFNNYDKALSVMPESAKNTLIDSVLVFSLEQFEEVRKNHPETWKEEIEKSINSIMNEMAEDAGFTPIGFKMHLDEGREENGKIILNPHAHLLFANICQDENKVLKREKKVTVKDENGKAMKDPAKPSRWLYQLDENGDVLRETEEVPLYGRMPLSMYGRGDSVWGRQQDIAAKHLNHLGFERGDKKELTNARHLDKTDFVARQLSKQEQIIEANSIFIDKKSEEIEVLDNKIKELENNKQSILERIKNSITNFISVREEAIRSALNIKEQTAEEFNDLLNEVSESFGRVDRVAQAEVQQNTQATIDRVKEGWGVSSESAKALHEISEAVQSKANQSTVQEKPKKKPKRDKNGTIIGWIEVD